MALTTYGYISEQILTTYYKGVRSDDSQYSLRHISSMVAQEVALMARKNAFENSNNGDVTYMNDQFITTYQSVPVLQILLAVTSIVIYQQYQLLYHIIKKLYLYH